MALPAFKNGKPLFKNGRPAFSGTPCTCCGCTCADLTATHPCAACGTGCTPRAIEGVVSGVVTQCCDLGGGRSMDGNGATLAGTFTLVDRSSCGWAYEENPGTAFNFRLYLNSVCSGSPSASNRFWELSVNVAGGTLTVIIIANVSAGTNSISFRGAVAFTGCSGSYTVHNGDGGQAHPCGTGGSVTITFCP